MTPRIFRRILFPVVALLLAGAVWLYERENAPRPTPRSEPAADSPSPRLDKDGTWMTPVPPKPTPGTAPETK